MRKSAKMFRLICVMMVLTLLVPHMAASAEDCYSGTDVQKTGIVICSTGSLRDAPDTNATKLATLKNGTLVPIVSKEGNFYKVDLASLDVKDLKVHEGYGYVLATLVATDMYFIHLDGYYFVYADPWYAEKSNGQKNGNFLVISDNGDWMAAQLTKGVAGSTFIKKSERGYPIYNYIYDGKWYGSSHSLVLRETQILGAPGNYDFVVGTLNVDDVVKKAGSVEDGYQPIEYNGYKCFISALDVWDIYGVQ